MHSSMQTIGEGYLDSMHKQMGSMLDNLYASVDDIFSRFNEISSTTFESIENRSTNMLEELSNTTRGVMDQMREQTSDLGFFTREINSEVSSLNDTLHQATVQYGEQMRLTLEGTFHVLRCRCVGTDTAAVRHDRTHSRCSGRIAVCGGCAAGRTAAEIRFGPWRMKRHRYEPRPCRRRT